MSIVLILLILNILFLHSSFLGILLGLVYLLNYGKKLGKWLFPEENKAYQYLFGIFFIFIYFSVSGAIIYYFYKLDSFVVIFILLTIPWLIKKLCAKYPLQNIPSFINDGLPAQAGGGGFDKNNSFWKSTFIKALQNFFLYIFNQKEFYRKIFTKTRNFLLSAKTLYLILFIILLKTSFSYSTTEAIRSPWIILPKWFLVLYFIATALIIIIITKEKPRAPLLFVIFHTFLTYSLALIIYKLGYGFDPFIHQATEKIIFEKGFILPKPLYYLGQYSLVVILANIFQKSTAIIDKLLVPLLYALCVPSFIYFSLKKFFNERTEAILLAVTAILILPSAAFIATTPQALANILAIIIIFLSLTPSFFKELALPARCFGGSDSRTGGQRGFFQKQSSLNFAFTNSANTSQKKIPFCLSATACADKQICPNLKKWETILIFLAGATILIHPLTGVAVFIFLVILFAINKKFRFKKIILPVIIIISSLIIPFIFSLSSTLKTKINFANVNIFSFSLLNIERQYNFIKDFIYLYGANISFVFIIISILGIIILLYRKNNRYADDFKLNFNILDEKTDVKKYAIITPYIITCVILFFNYIILKNFISFNALIYYEQNNYAERLFSLMLYFLLPFFIIAFYYFFEKLTYSASFVKLFFISLFALWITASFYLTYPRYDNYASDRGYNVSEPDFHAVEFINSRENNNNYIVLANQNTSAAVLAKYGFLKYFANEKNEAAPRPYNSEHGGEKIFYYPIPTSSPLYDYYLEMVNIKPTRAIMKKAMDLVGVKTGYFVICDYWWKADQIIEKAKLEADEYYSIDKGKIFVFKYKM